MRTILLPALCIFFLSFLDVHADLYRWQDANGSWHVANDIEKVPERYRDQAKTKALKEPEVETSPAADQMKEQPAVEALPTPKKMQTAKGTSNTAPEQKTYTIEYEETDHNLGLEVTLNDNHTFTFMLDTGASFVVLSKETAEEMGYDPEKILPRLYFSTANGIISSRLIRLESIKVGEAILRDVTAVVQEEDNLAVQGLLGLSFLNEFDWSNDTMNEVLTLREFTNRPEEDVYGGHNEKWWRKKFEEANKKIKYTEEERDAWKALRPKTSNKKKFIEEHVRILEANRTFFREELEILDRKANRYQVPRYWR